MGKRGLACESSSGAFPPVSSIVGQEIFRISCAPEDTQWRTWGGRGRTVRENLAWLVDERPEVSTSL